MLNLQLIYPLDFNPRSYVRSDYSGIVNKKYPYKFQSTLLREERRKCKKEKSSAGHDFNPRSYVRSDAGEKEFKEALKDFNPRSYVRSDRRIAKTIVHHVVFQSTLLREERQMVKR